MGPARAHAAHRSARGAARRPTAASSCSPTRTARSGIAPSSPKARRSCGGASRGTDRARIRSRRRSTRSTAMRATADATDWRQILQLYDQLLAIAPSPVVALNRAVAVAEVEGPHAALDIVEALDLGSLLSVPRDPRGPVRRSWPRFAAVAHEAAIARTGNAAERESSWSAAVMLRRADRGGSPSLRDLDGRIGHRAQEPVQRRAAPQHSHRDRALCPKMTCVTPSRWANAISPSAGRSALTRTTVAPRLSASRMFSAARRRRGG